MALMRRTLPTGSGADIRLPNLYTSNQCSRQSSIAHYEPGISSAQESTFGGTWDEVEVQTRPRSNGAARENVELSTVQSVLDGYCVPACGVNLLIVSAQGSMSQKSLLNSNFRRTPPPALSDPGYSCKPVLQRSALTRVHYLEHREGYFRIPAPGLRGHTHGAFRDSESCKTRQVHGISTRCLVSVPKPSHKHVDGDSDSEMLANLPTHIV